MSTTSKLGPLLRSEADVAADVVAALIHAGVVAKSAPAIRRAADVLGIEVAAIQRSHERQKAHTMDPLSTRYPRAGEAPRQAAPPPAPPPPAPEPDPDPKPDLDPAPETRMCRNECGNPAAVGRAYCGNACQDAHFRKGGPPPTKDEASVIGREAATRTERFQKSHPEPGKIRCGKCTQVKPEADFPIKDQATGRRRTACQPCWNAQQRVRYLSVEHTERLNEVGLEFVLGEVDGVKLVCQDCKQPIVAGQDVRGETILRHKRCPDGDAPLSVQILKALHDNGGEVVDKSGRATGKLVGPERFGYTVARVNQVLGELCEQKLIERDLEAKRTYRITLLPAGLTVLDEGGYT